MHSGRRDILFLFLLALLVRLVMAAFITQPGYMDASYYAAGAVNLAQGGGFSEPFIWNYLNDPAGIPHPGFLYWMPLPSLLAAPFAALFPNSYFALQVPFAFISALLPLLAYEIAWRVTERRRLAWAAGLLTLFSGFFFPYWTIPETFAPFALFGSSALLAVVGSYESEGKEVGNDPPRLGRPSLLLLVSGVLVGLAHLTRADGVLLLPVVALTPLLLPRLHRGSHLISPFRHLLLIAVGYLLAMSPWFARNWVVVGSPLPSTGTKTLWLTSYDDLFCCECDLSLNSYLAWGWSNILRSKTFALWANFQRFLAEDCLVFLFPFIMIGFYRLRRRGVFVLSLLYLLLIYLAHSLAFTFPGWRGGFFHASAPLLPFLAAWGVVGLDTVIRWASRRRRHWNRRWAQLVFTWAAVIAAVALSLYVSSNKLPAWRESGAAYQKVDRWLDRHNIPKEAGIMVGNPPGFWYHTRRTAVVVPNENVERLLKAARAYRVEYLLLDWNCPAPLYGLYAGEEGNVHLSRVADWSVGARPMALYSVRRPCLD